MKLPHLLGLFLGLLAASLPAAAPQGFVSGHAATKADLAPVDAALASVDPDAIEADLRFLADDELRGRDTVSPGLRIAARYLRARLDLLGFQPGAGDRYLYGYPLEGRQLERGSLTATLTLGGQRRELVHGRDYRAAGRWAVTDLEREAGVVSCGDGGEGFFDAEELDGCWALCRYSGQSLWRLYWRAQRAGAVGLLLVSDDDAELGPVLAHFGADADRAFSERVSWPAKEGDGGRRRPPFPVLALSDELRDALLAGAPADGGRLDAQLAERRSADENPIVAENVCGLWPGSDPELRNEVILISAHYDHVGASGGEIYNGADDNGSGTSGLLALAEALVEYGPMRRSVMLIWVSGEEKGLWGSRAWAENPLLPDGMRPIANLNIDMIGRNGPKVLYVTPSREHEGYNGLTALMERFASAEGFGSFPEGEEQGYEGLGSADDYYGRSDHAQFAKLGIPVCFLFSGVHEDYHRPTDTVDKIDYDKIRRVVRLVIRALDALQTDELNLSLE